MALKRELPNQSGKITRNQISLFSGFTLIEMLVTLTILAIILLVAVSTFMSVMIKSTKVRVVKAVENDGYYALRTMERLIKNSKEIRGSCQEDMNSLTIVDFNNQETNLSCLNEGNPDPQLSFIALTNGTSQRLTSPEVRLNNCRFDCFPGNVEEPDQVKIFFQLNQAIISQRREEQATLDFQTSVTMRNY